MNAGRAGLAISSRLALTAFATTGVGSLPLPIAEAARHAVGAYEVPFCPQLPRIEGNMIDEWLGADPGRCGWSADRDRERPAVWDAFCAELQADPPEHGWVKLQATGPVTLAIALQRESARPGQGREMVELAAEISEWLASIVAEQVRRMGDLGLRTMLFVDEPGLHWAGLHPAGVAVYDPLRGGLVGAAAFGLHVCGPPPWSLIAAIRPDLVSFDLAHYGIAPGGIVFLRNHLRGGGRVVWGAFDPVAPGGSLAAFRRVHAAIMRIVCSELDHELIAAHSMLSAACGSGRLAPETERLIAAMLQAAADRLRTTSRGLTPSTRRHSRPADT